MPARLQLARRREQKQLALFDFAGPSLDGQGQGASTELKERFIKLALAVNLKITSHPSKFISHFPYWHLDLHAGSGWNQRANCAGTPIVFLEGIAQFHKPYRAFFCEKNLNSIQALHEHPQIVSNPHAYVFHGDNREVLPVFAECIRRSREVPRFAMGTIVVDPNGYLNPETVPLELLASFCHEFERIDLLMHLNVRTLALERPHIRRGKGKWNGRGIR